MVEFSDADRNRARQFVESLLRDRSESEREFPQGFSLADVQADADSFRAEIETVSSFGEDFPVVRMEGGAVPVSLSVLVSHLGAGAGGSVLPPIVRGSLWHRYSYEWWREVFWHLHRGSERVEAGGLEVEFVSPSQAQEHFLSKATDFLATRLSWVRNWRKGQGDGGPPGGGPSWHDLNLPPSRNRPPTTVPGCTFSVSTNTPNLRVHWSGAYYISPNYFGHPTSPARGPLQAGTYVFGVDGGAYGHSICWDLQAVCTLPGQSTVHLNY